MIKDLFLILCGEDEIKRPRSKQLLHMLKHKTHYKVIVSGFSSFTSSQDSSESSRVSDYLVKNGIQRYNILLEEQSMDTLGNIIFSHRIAESLLEQYPRIASITLITETFHLYRSQKLFRRIFAHLLIRYPIQLFFMGSENQELEHLYREYETNVIITDFYQGRLLRKDIQQFMYTLSQRRQRDAKEIAILELLLADFRTFHLRTFDQFQNYLYNLPVYNTVYHAKKILNLGNSLYSKAINYAMTLR